MVTPLELPIRRVAGDPSADYGSRFGTLPAWLDELPPGRTPRPAPPGAAPRGAAMPG